MHIANGKEGLFAPRLSLTSETFSQRLHSEQWRHSVCTHSSQSSGRERIIMSWLHLQHLVYLTYCWVNFATEVDLGLAGCALKSALKLEVWSWCMYICIYVLLSFDVVSLVFGMRKERLQEKNICFYTSGTIRDRRRWLEWEGAGLWISVHVH